MSDQVVLLAAAVLFLAFIAYELAALAFPRWHTVSWYAAHQVWIRIAIALLFVAGLLWWLHHSAGPIFK